MTLRSIAGVAVLTVALLGLATVASAQTEEYSDTFSFPLSPGGTNMFLPQFNDMGGTRTLQSVYFEITAEVGSNITAENDSTLAAPAFQVSLTGLVGATAPGLSTSVGLASTWGFALDPTDGFAKSGPDYHDFGYLSDSGSDNDSLPPGDLSPYIGTGNVTIDITGSAGWGFQGTTDATLTIDNLGASGRAKIIYTYTPEPASLLLVGLVLPMIRRR